MAKDICYCIVDGCNKRVHGNDLCMMHYMRLLRYGSYDKPITPKKIVPCTVCGKPATARKLCQIHYRQQVLNGPNRPQCTVDHCSRPLNSNGLCAYHYNLLRDTGSTTPKPRPTVEERFWSKVNKNSGKFFEGTECWEWTANLQDGYGKFGVRAGNVVPSHRYSYESVHGKLTRIDHVHHLCDNKACVNPTHLEAKTSTDHAYITMAQTLGRTDANLELIAETLRRAGWTCTPPKNSFETTTEETSVE